MKRNYILLAGVALAMVLVACGGGEVTTPASKSTTTPTTSQPTAPEAGAYQPVAVTNGGVIAGVVSYSGTPPPSGESLSVNKDTDICGTSKVNEKLQVSSGGGIRNAVVYIRDITSGKAMTFPAVATLDQEDCVYTPHVIIGREGGTLEVHNSDPVLHNVHSYTFDNPPINRAQPKGSGTIKVNLELAEIYEIGCDIHGWMSSWLVVAEHPYYVITGNDGSFNLSDVPAGTYAIEVWHETLGVSKQTVTVTAGGTAQLGFTLASK